MACKEPGQRPGAVVFCVVYPFAAASVSVHARIFSYGEIARLSLLPVAVYHGCLGAPRYVRRCVVSELILTSHERALHRDSMVHGGIDSIFLY